MEITRIHDDYYIVGSVRLARGETLATFAGADDIVKRGITPTDWAAVTVDGYVLFHEPDLDSLFRFTNNAVRMLQPA